MYRYIPPEEAAPLLLDRSVSPVVAFDTEFDTDESGLPTCRAGLTGLSMAGGTPGDGIFGTFWHFGGRFGAETWPWDVLRERVLRPIVTDPNRVLTAHPMKTDAQILRARGLPGHLWRCRIACSMSGVHAHNENLPKGLKELAYALLGVPGLTSYKQTQAEIKGILKAGEKEVKAILRAAWEYYRDWRKTRKDGTPGKARATKGTDGPYAGPRVGWMDLVDRLPAFGVTASDVQEYIRAKVEPVVMGDFRRRARERFALYGAEDAIYALGVHYYLEENTPPEMADIVHLETSVCHPVVTEMEERGLKIDIDFLLTIQRRMEEAAAELRAQVVQEWGVENGLPDFNPASEDQKAHVLWEVWKLRPPPWAMRGGALDAKWTRKKDGLCKTDKNVLAALISKGGRYADTIRRMLTLGKIENNLSDPIRPMVEMVRVDPDNRLHSSFWPVGARTGRFASSDINVENVPRPDTMPCITVPPGADPQAPPEGCVKIQVGVADDGRPRYSRDLWRVASLRDVFVAPDGFLLVAADLSQIENRIVAHESGDPTLLAVYRRWDCAECGASGETDRALHACPECGAPDGRRDKTKPDQPAVEGFCLGRDIHAHSSVAVGFFTRWGYKAGRQAAKALNHAASYGMGAQTMARYYDMKVKECEEALVQWHARHPYVRGRLHREVERAVREDGYVRMFTGHVRRFHAAKLLLDSGNFRRWEWEKIIREGVNSKAQGGTAGIIKQTMIDMRQHVLDTASLRGRVFALNQIHDEILYEVEEDRAEEALTALNYHMENNRLSQMLRVPVISEGGIGKTWGSAKP